MPICLTLLAAVIIICWSFYSGNIPEWTELKLQADNTIPLPTTIGCWWFLPLAVVWTVLFHQVSKIKGLNKQDFTDGAWVGVFPTLIVGMSVYAITEDQGLYFGLKAGLCFAFLFGMMAGLAAKADGGKIAGVLMGMIFGSGLITVVSLALCFDQEREVMGQFEGGVLGLLVGFVLGFFSGLALARVPKVQQTARKLIS